MTVRQTVVFQSWTSGDGIFFTKETFDRLRRIAQALRHSKTWGEFRAALPQGEFEALGLWRDNYGEYVYREGKQYFGVAGRDLKEFLSGEYEDPEESTISSDSPFHAEAVPGVGDGDYPRWVSSTATNQLPEAFVRKYGRSVDSFTSGSWTEFPSDRLDEMKKDLEAAGFEVLVHLGYDWDEEAE